MSDAVAVLDVGKTNLKLLAVGPGGAILARESATSRPLAGPPWAHADVEHIWSWFLAALGRLARRHPIAAIVPTAYGSTAALVGQDGRLAFPVMDYEDEPPAWVRAAYEAVRPPFAEVCAPTNPAGLTLGRQIFRQARADPEAFARVRWILPFAQYWSWRLTGVPAAEVTSLGAQTHLWDPARNAYSSLVRGEGWERLFPPLRRAFDTLGPIRPEVAEATGLAAGTPVLCGIHDSNASYLRYLAAGLGDFTLMSTGTWLISFNPAFAIARLDASRDCASNTDVAGRPVASSRFMAGREYAILALPEAHLAVPTIADVERLMAAGTMALPSFTDSGGPFAGTGGRGRIIGRGPRDATERVALATLYTALMSSAAIDAIGSQGDIVIDGGFAGNALYCRLIAALRPGQRVRVLRERDGSALGAALLWRWEERRGPVPLALKTVLAPKVRGVGPYARHWLEEAAGNARGEDPVRL